MGKGAPVGFTPCVGIARPAVLAVLSLALAATILAGVGKAYALSEIKREDLGQQAPSSESEDESIRSEPLPPPEGAPTPGSAGPREPAGELEPGQPQEEEESDPADQSILDPNAPLPEVIYDLDRLPEPVRQKRQAIVDACRSGDIERLRPLLDTGENGTQLSFGGMDGDPITYLKELSGDEEGREILAILEEVLSAGYVHLDAGTINDMYVWPYFFAIPLTRLTPAQEVELFKIVTAGDLEEMKNYGTYIFYRVGITPDGKWSFFVAGD